MSGSITEWEFTADVAKWIDRIITTDDSLPFSEAKCEQRGRGSNKRRDLTLLDRNQVVVLTGEVKLPYQRDGGSPYNAAVVKDARKKARRAKSDFFFTWNVNEFVLWETTPASTSWKAQDYKSWDVTNVIREEHIELPMTIHAIKAWLATFLNEFAQILRGTAAIGRKPPDEKFVDTLESHLKMPVLQNLEELERRYSERRFKSELDQWMVKDRGWVLRDDRESIRDSLLSASRFACYALVNKLVFHEALLRRYGRGMDRLTVPEHIDKGEGLRSCLEKYFAVAQSVTGDYETVFGEEHLSIGNRIPFYSDHAVHHWRALVEQIHRFDFSKLAYDVIGSIFERLIGEEMRKKYGQFYTRVEVVDLINSFCIRTGREKVMDPACGGGTFLVRAYARKQVLARSPKHGEILSDLFGVDKELFATHLTTINLATRDLVHAENYPQIARSDFFDIEKQKSFVSLPTHIKAKGLGKIQHRQVDVPLLDAVIGNPPYIRQEDIPKAEKRGKHGWRRRTKQYYQQIVKDESGAVLSGRSDIHCYFWPHAASFLKDAGYLCFLTSSQWLDVEYGFRLQEWILRNFKIVAILESIDEPWFVGARVATTVTILRRQKDEAVRTANTVRCVQLRRPIRELLAHDGTTAGAVQAADSFRDEILKLKSDTANERYRARLVSQGKLWEDGVHLGKIMGKPSAGDAVTEIRSDDSKDEQSGDDPKPQTGEYYGGKWGVYLRAPDLWFELLDKYGARLAPLGKIADVRFGVKSGKDCFFFPKDCSAECLQTHKEPIDFEATYGVPRREVESGKVKLVQCGKGYGEIRPIEAEYLEPEVHTIMDIDGYSVRAGDCSRWVLLLGERRSEIGGEYTLRYVNWGERQRYHTGPTCSSRARSDRGWYDLTGHKRGALFWPMAQQYKHTVPANDDDLICNHRLFDVSPKDFGPAVLGGLLNSTWVLLSKYQFGRPVGVEGHLDTEVIDVKMMLVPDPSGAPEASRERVGRAFDKLKKRKVLYFLSERRLREMAYRQAGKADELLKLSDECELDMADRRELDEAVLDLMGVRSKKKRQELTDALYEYLRDFFEAVRQKEEKAIANKKAAKRRGAARPSEVAAEIYADILDNHGHLLRRYDPGFLDRSREYDTYDLPAQGTAKAYPNLFADHGVLFSKGKRQVALIETKNPAQDGLIVTLAGSGIRGFVCIPCEEGECRRLEQEYGRFVRNRDGRIRSMIEERADDEDMQEKILDALMMLILQGK